MVQTETAIFSEASVQFLRDLRENNNREWFEAHKQTYINAVQTPAIELVETIGMGLQAGIAEAISFDTATNGSGSMMRIYRDIRFSKDKTPYKTNVAMMFWQGESKKTALSSLGLQITPDDAGVMAGTFGFEKAALERYRQAVVSEAGHELVKIIAQIQAAGDYTLNGTHYKRSPRGFDMPNDARDPYLLHNGLWISSPTIPLAVVTSANFVDVMLNHFETMAPLHNWLVQVMSA